MKCYSVLPIYRIPISIFVIFLAYVTLKEIIDPHYHVGGAKYIPRAVLWYFNAYLAYKYLTTAYRIELTDDGSINTISLVRKTIVKASEIMAIRDHEVFIEIVLRSGTVTICTLMDGIGDIKKLFPPCEPKPRKQTTRRIILQILFLILLLGFAIYIEWQQMVLRTQS